MMQVNYEEIEELLNNLLVSIVELFSDSESEEVKEFLGAGEYGLALETLVDIIDEEKKMIPHSVFMLIKKTAVAMRLNEESFERRLKRNVVPAGLDENDEEVTSQKLKPFDFSAKAMLQELSGFWLSFLFC